MSEFLLLNYASLHWRHFSLERSRATRIVFRLFLIRRKGAYCKIKMQTLNTHESALSFEVRSNKPVHAGLSRRSADCSAVIRLLFNMNS
jgi:hypothetical protein